MNALVMNCSPVRSGATAETVSIIAGELSGTFDTKAVCIDDYSFGFCRGCRSCHSTAVCVQSDDTTLLMAEFDNADIIVCVSPSYWADVPAQFKAFIDRCTPWCNTHEPHAKLKSGKKGYTAVLRTGPNMKECQRIIGTVEHFYGHLEIECCGSLGLCSVECREDVLPRKAEIISFCNNIKSPET
ncbi:MAG: flavodoxin family protein [Ruminococcus sp.]|nr:flavodoxin family protein [Ruminococcus sp.]